MKTHFTHIITLLSFLYISSFSIVSAQESQWDDVSLKLTGIGCPYCSIGFIKKVESLGEVKDMDAVYETGVFTFKIRTDAAIRIESIQEVTVDTDYTLVYAEITHPDGTTDLYGDRPKK